MINLVRKGRTFSVQCTEIEVEHLETIPKQMSYLRMNTTELAKTLKKVFGGITFDLLLVSFVYYTQFFRKL